MKRTRGLWTAAMAMLIVAFAASPVLAGDLPVRPSGGVLQFLREAGFIGWVIIALSLVVGALWIEYLASVTKGKLLPPDLLEELTEPAEKGDVDEAIRLCEESPGFYTNIVASGLTHVNLGAMQAGQAMQNVRDEETAMLLAKIGWLRLIADVSPMLGLLGTVWGMMRAVGKYTTQQTTMRAFAAQGISQALITTLLGLIVAIIATSVYFFFRTRVIRMSLEVSEAAEEMVLRIARSAQDQ